MQSGSSTVASGSPHIGPRKGFLDRLSSPFGSKTRTIVEFTVQADDPHRRYTPGDIVKGTVILKVARAVRITHIVVCLHGFVQVYKTPGVPPSDGFRAHNNLLGKGRGKRRGEYFGNGFATLFEDEQVICGDGRLGEGNYKFQFEMRFPEETLPSSIDFERGTISYMITATMTRPTSISPVAFHDQKIAYAERIDVSKLLPPQPRTISLVALVRRGPRQGHGKRKATHTDSMPPDSASLSGTGNRSIVRSSASAADDDGRSDLRSPSPSVQSFTSRHSSGEQNSVVGACMLSARGSENGSARNSTSISERSKDIVVTVESLKGGTLRGETVPLRIFINHTKHIRSMQGAIVTLYRHARVDTHPALPVGPTTDGEKRKFEDYYPKSLTGLGGLSLSGAGSSHIFRKDLSQTVLPLIVDPSTLTAELHPKLRVPEDAFPTIACVPGAMISFRYYLEVILDIQGKLASSDRYFGATSGSTMEDGSLDHSTMPEDPSRWQSSAYHRPLVDTSAIRRDRSVVTCVLEIVIGTLDSDRKKGKARAIDPAEERLGQDAYQQSQAGAGYYQNSDYASPGAHWQTHQGTGEDYPPDAYGAEEPTYTPYDGQYYGPDAGYYDEHGAYDWRHDTQQEESYEFSPPPLAEDDAQISEKERLRRAEMTLLPSHPPGAYDGDASGADHDESVGPSAPSAADLASPASGYTPHDMNDFMMLEPGPDAERSSAPRYSQVVVDGRTFGGGGQAAANHDRGLGGDDRAVGRFAPVLRSESHNSNIDGRGAAVPRVNSYTSVNDVRGVSAPRSDSHTSNNDGQAVNNDGQAGNTGGQRTRIGSVAQASVYSNKYASPESPPNISGSRIDQAAGEIKSASGNSNSQGQHGRRTGSGSTSHPRPSGSPTRLSNSSNGNNHIPHSSSSSHTATPSSYANHRSHRDHVVGDSRSNSLSNRPTYPRNNSSASRTGLSFLPLINSDRSDASIRDQWGIWPDSPPPPTPPPKDARFQAAGGEADGPGAEGAVGSSGSAHVARDTATAAGRTRNDGSGQAREMSAEGQPGT